MSEVRGVSCEFSDDELRDGVEPEGDFAEDLMRVTDVWRGTDDPCDASMKLCDVIDGYYAGADGLPLYGVRLRWFMTFDAVLRREGFSSQQVVWLFENLVRGNWKRLHLRKKEEKKTQTEWLQEFRDEVFYCSDRWSMDRLTRCHWLYRQAIECGPTYV